MAARHWLIRTSAASSLAPARIGVTVATTFEPSGEIDVKATRFAPRTSYLSSGSTKGVSKVVQPSMPNAS